MRVCVDAVGNIPVKAHEHDAGFDLAITEEVILDSLERVAVGTGLFLAIPPGVVGDVRPRSGLSMREGVTVINSPGTLDPGYRGEVKVSLVNLSRDTVTLPVGTRVAQLVFLPVVDVSLMEVEVLPVSGDGRGTGGYGSSGS